MSITHFANSIETTPRQSNRASGRAFPNGSGVALAGAEAERRPAKLWLNPGYYANGTFISLPVGIPLDTMQPMTARGQNEDYLKRVQAQNQLLKALQQAADQLAPGETVDIQLTLQLRRVNDEMVVEGNNEYAMDFSSLIAPALQAAE